MKIKFQCNKCFKEGVNTYDSVQVNAEVLYNYKCSKGHENSYFLKNEKFELLIESAISAISNGYYLEAISSFSSSLERLQEYLSKVIFCKYIFSDETFHLAWKEFSKQSERQLGAFIILYLKEFKVLPDMLTNNERGFRNDVIHKGKFPTYDETIKYGQRVLDITFNNLSQVRNKLERVIIDLSEERHQLIMEDFKKRDLDQFTTLIDTCININHEISSIKKINLIDYLKSFDNKK